MAVRNGGLDIGFFAPASAMSLKDAQHRLTRFKEILLVGAGENQRPEKSSI